MDAQANLVAAEQGTDGSRGVVALERMFDQLAMLEDTVGALVPELDRVLNPHDPSGDGDRGDSEPAPAVSPMTGDLERVALRLEALRGTLQSVRRRLEL